jgi:hypothetical protein
VLDIVVHQNISPSRASVCDALHLDHLPIAFLILDPVTFNELLEPLEELRDWGRFQSLASNILSP